MGEPSGNNRRQRAAIQTTIESSFNHSAYPPDYSSVLTADMATSSNAPNDDNGEYGPRILINSETYRHQTRRHTTTNFPSNFPSLEKIDSFSSTMPRRSVVPVKPSSNEQRYLNLTANDVAQLLRATQQNSMESQTTTFHLSPDNQVTTCDTNEDYSLTRSVEELVLNEMPPGESAAAAANSDLCDK